MKELAAAFLRLGFTAFGGPAAHLAMMEEEFVRRRGWLTHEEFLDLIGAANLIPGPNSTEVAIHIGYRRAGLAGLVIAGLCFILPAALIVTAIAWAYVRYGALPAFGSALYGIKPVVVSVVAQAVFLLARSTLTTWPKRGVAFVVAGLSITGGGQLWLLLGSGVLLSGSAAWRVRDLRAMKPLAGLLGSIAALAALPIAWEALVVRSVRPTPGALFAAFLKTGSVLYGSGYVLLAFLQGDFVDRWHWLTRGQLLDATAVGQFTPGPVFTTATFIGYILHGPWGALAATAGIFLPGFLFVAISGRLLPKLRKAPVTAAFLDGVNSAALGLMAVVTVILALDAIRDVATGLIALVAVVALIRFRVNSALLIALGGVVGVVLRS